MTALTFSEEVNDIQFKARAGQTNIDKAQGIVECFVAAIGNKDSVGDIIVPGAFDGSLKRRKPRVVWGHNWNEPIGKVLDIVEVKPRDRRLPEKMRKAGVGGLYARVQFNMNSQRGKEAFANVAFFGEEQEWSIGYKTIDADYDPQHQANVLKEVELYEVSPVLHGANQLTGTLSVKDNEASECGRDGELCAVKDFVAVEEKTLETEEEVTGLKKLLEKAINTAFDQDATLWDFDDAKAVVTKNDEAWVISYTFNKDANEFLFSQPKAAVLETFVRVLDEETKGAGCGCGPGGGGCSCDGAKSEGGEMEEKAGRKISSTNLTKITQVIDTLQSIVSEVMPSEGPLERKDPEEKVLMPGSYEEFSEILPFECKTEDEIADVVEALVGVGVAVRFPTPEAFASGNKTLEVLLPGSEEAKVSVALAMGKALSNIEWLSTEPAQ
jgi:HK97 family phage prohead protease